MRKALVWLNLCGREAVCHMLKNKQNVFFVFLGCFWSSVGQPHDHISWDTPMSFASIIPIWPSNKVTIANFTIYTWSTIWHYLNPTNLIHEIHEIFIKKIRIGGAGKWGFFLRWPFWIFFFKKNKKKLLHSNKNQSTFSG